MPGKPGTSWLKRRNVSNEVKGDVEVGRSGQPCSWRRGNGILEEETMAHARTQLLDELLVLVELLELLNIHGINTNAACLLAVLHITEDAKLHLGAGHVRKLDRAAETLVLLGIIVLQTNLKLNGLSELPLLILRTLQDS